MSNNHLLTIDDAVSVAMRCINDEIDLDKETFNYIEWLLRSEFEQKCFISELPTKDLGYVIGEINPRSIANEITNDSLGEWCSSMQIDLQMRIADVLKKGD